MNPKPTVIVRIKEKKAENNDNDASSDNLSLDISCLVFSPALIQANFEDKQMNQMLSTLLEDRLQRVECALTALRQGHGILVLDDEDRENEGDMIFSAEKLTVEQMALTIRHGSGIVCLCITEEKRQQLNLPFMVEHNTSRNHTPFTISIEAAQGVTTGVSAEDRVTTIKTAIAEQAKPSDLHRPGHVFPLRAAAQGVLERKGHTEATVDLMRLSGLKPYGVLCELMLDNGTMARAADVVQFGTQHQMPVVTVEDIVHYRVTHHC